MRTYADYAFKFGFLVWCFVPQQQGAHFLYLTVIMPIVKRHEGSVPAKKGN